MSYKDDYKTYLEKYARSNNISIEEAAKHKLVQLTKEYYEEREEGR